MKFRVTHSKAAPKAKRFRYSIVASNGQTLQSGEGYPTGQHVFRAVTGLWKSMLKAVNTADAARARATPGATAVAHPLDIPVPFTADSLKPGDVAALATASKPAKPAPRGRKVADIAQSADPGYEDR